MRWSPKNLHKKDRSMGIRPRSQLNPKRWRLAEHLITAHGPRLHPEYTELPSAPFCEEPQSKTISQKRVAY